MIPRQIKKPMTAWNIAELAIGSISVLTIFVGLGIWIYQGSHIRDIYCGRIVDKRISVFESKQGSYFVNELSIEDEKGDRFKVQVLEEVYKRAVPGMLIRKSSKGLELFTDQPDCRSIR